MKRKQINYRGEICLNCNTSLDKSEKYCHACGQLNSTKKLTISDFIEEFFSNFYAYDSRLRNSIISIFTKPGVLAREFNAGKRLTYANPFRLFLSVTLVLFISYKITEGNDTKKEIPVQNEIEERDSIYVKNKFFNAALTYKNELHLNKDSIYSKQEIEDSIQDIIVRIEYQILTFRNFHLKYPDKTEKQTLKELGYEDSFFNRFVYSKSLIFNSTDIGEEIFNYFYGQLPFFLFLALPFLTLIFWLVFYSKDRNYTEHLVFAYTFYTFIFLVLLLLSIMQLVIDETVLTFIHILCFLLLFPIYFYISLRNFYQQKTGITLLKWFLLHPLFLFIIILTMGLLFIIGAVLF